MAIKAVYDNREDVPEQHEDLYEERHGKWRLKKIEGMATQADIDRVQTSLEQERKDHKETKGKLEKLGPLVDLDPAEVVAKLDKYPELEAAADGKLDGDKISELADKRVAAKLAPVERERDQLRTRAEELEAQNTELNGSITKGKIERGVRRAAETAKVVPTALDDVVMMADRLFEVLDDGTLATRDNVGVTPGIAPEIWLSDMQESRPHWWPASVGGGAGGSGKGGTFAKNPWAKEHWNLTEQGKVVAEKGLATAEQYAANAGSKVGATRPAQPSK